MARRNIIMKIKDGSGLAARTGCDLGADELNKIHDCAAGSEFTLARYCFLAGLAIGYQRRKAEEAKKRKATARRFEEITAETAG